MSKQSSLLARFFRSACFSPKLAVVLATLGLTTLAKAQSVTLTDNGTTITLANGLVSATIQKSDGKVTTMTLGGSPNLVGSKGFYYTTHVVSGSTDDWVGIATGGSTYSVTTNTSSLVDISIRNPTLGYDATNFPYGIFDVDMHLVMRSGVAGLYRYFIWNHTANQPAAALYQQRTVVADTSLSSLGSTVYSYCGGDVWNNSPGSVLSSGTSIYDSTYELPATTAYTYPTGTSYGVNWPKYYSPNALEMIGVNYDSNPVWTKYDWSVYSGPTTSFLNTFGAANDQYGVWILNPSSEYLNGGPTKLRGTVQDDSMGVNTNDGHGLGDSGPDESLAAGQIWQKIFGPYLIYANTGTSHTALYSDAQTKGAAEVAAWPYSWLTSPGSSLYPISRGTITGTLSIPGQSAANAQIVVCDNPGIDWTWQGAMNYLFSAQADAKGNFSVPNVRPGTYSIFAYVPGVLGDFQMDSVAVTAGSTTALGTITWNPPLQQQRLFRVGTPDRSTGEFRYGNMPKQFGLWFHYLDEVGATGSVSYTVGTSDPAANWYYAQPVVAAADGTYAAPAWYINFNLPAVPPSPCTLKLALAGSAGSGAFHVYVNGTDVDTDTYHGTYTADDSALDRDAILRGLYQVFSFNVSTSLLHAGTNTVKITVRKTGASTWTGTRPVAPAYGIMYDCVQLEAGASTTNVLLSQSKGTAASSSNGINTAGKGNNGSTGDRWQASAGTFPQWWRVDLGAAHTLRSIVTNWYQNTTNSYQYKIEASNDDVNYTTVVDKTGNTSSGISYDTLPSTTQYRYVRIRVTGSSGQWASFYETQVYGD
ncbi:MAG: polysaccharide lyase family protein [Chthoniobacteraceae bacterium]